jgi:taurine dioxygenase
MQSRISVTPLTSTIGARVDGIDLREDLTEDVREQLRQALWDHHVVVVPSQEVGLDGQNRLTTCFGPLEPGPTFRFLGELSPTVAVDVVGGGHMDEQGRQTRALSPERRADRADTPPPDYGEFQDWHTDSSFPSQIVQAASLRAEIIPPVGGDTLFGSLCDAYDALSPAMQKFCETLNAVHAPHPTYKNSLHFEQYGEDAEARFATEFPPREHPMVIEHPHSHRKALFINPKYVVRIAGLTNRESANLLRFLYGHIVTPDFVYRHHWSPGDLVVWDELVCVHLAPRDYQPHPRRLVRVTAGLVTPTAPGPVPVTAGVN